MNPVTQNVQKKATVDAKSLNAATAALNDDVQKCLTSDGSYNVELFNLTNFINNLVVILQEAAKVLPSFIPEDEKEKSEKLEKEEEAKKQEVKKKEKEAEAKKHEEETKKQAETNKGAHK